MKRVSIVMLLFFSTGCRFEPEVLPDDYDSYKFDGKVIEKLPIYDSLANAILEKYLFFQKHMNMNESYHAYKYMPGSDQADVFTNLPLDIAPRINYYFTKLGENFIYGFDLFEDSTIKIHVRNRLSEKLQGTIEESLSFFPLGSHIRKREFPVKDTILNKNWQYWTRYNRRRLF